MLLDDVSWKTSWKSSRTLVSMHAGLIVALLLSGCMSSRKEEELKSAINELRLESAKTREELARKDLALGTIKNSSEDANRKVLGTKGEMEELRRQLSLTQGAVDELQAKMTRLMEVAGKSGNDEGSSLKISEMEEHSGVLERRVARLELALKNVKDKSLPKGKAVKISAGDLEESLVKLAAQKDFKKVIAQASHVLASDPADDVAEVALRYRGEAYFAMQEYEQAAIDLGDFVERFPRSAKRARALLFTGDSYVYLKNKRLAKSYYQECVSVAPDRDECKASKDRLGKLGV